MDAKEKAVELFTTYRFALSIPNAPLGEYKDQIAKQCAKIAVDEIIETTFMKATYIDWGFSAIQKISTTDYWIEVKEEIEKL
jgi:hypothetical protein